MIVQDNLQRMDNPHQEW